MVPLSGRSNLARGPPFNGQNVLYISRLLWTIFTKGKIVLKNCWKGRRGRDRGEAGTGERQGEGGRQGGIVGEGEGLREEKALQVGEQHNYP
jgi:hypothetical protein